MVTVEVQDDGPGIPPGEAERVFEPFHRLEGSRNRETGGVGLGLPIARNILRAHGGDLTLANRPEGGARAGRRSRYEQVFPRRGVNVDHSRPLAWIHVGEYTSISAKAVTGSWSGGSAPVSIWMS